MFDILRKLKQGALLIDKQLHHVDLGHLASVAAHVVAIAATDIEAIRSRKGDNRIDEAVDLVWPLISAHLPPQARRQDFENALRETAKGIAHLAGAARQHEAQAGTDTPQDHSGPQG